jgi:glycosyltransferase involved in cell wall biosynthesis
MNAPKFTFCIPNLNKIDFLPACIESMLAQDNDAWHCVFVDGYSTDGSWEYMQQFANDSRFNLLRGKRQGMYEDWNYCLEQVNTEYYAILTSDDLCHPQLISKTTQALDKYTDINACHFKFEYIDAQASIIRTYEDVIQAEMPIYLSSSNYAHRRSALFEFMMHFVYRTIYRTITSLVLRKKTIAEVGRFSSRFGSAGDYDWTMRLALSTDVLFLPETLTAWRKYEGQATQSPLSAVNTKRVIDIARANLKRFKQSDTLQTVSKVKGNIPLMACLSHDYEMSLYNRIGEGVSLPENFGYLLLALKSYPLHYFEKALKRLGRKTTKAFIHRDDLAAKLIQDYYLTWPPMPTDL